MNTGKNKDTLQDLHDRKKYLQSRIKSVRQLYWITLLLFVATIILLPFLYFRLDEKSFMFGPVLYGVMFFISVIMTRTRRREFEEDIQETDFQIDLEEFQVPNSEKRAEKLLRINSYQLRRYYDLNLSQNNWVFGLGISCIVLGLSVIVGTIYIIMKANLSLYSNIIIGAVGSVGSILTNYIAAIYLKMHTSASENLKEFHGRLVETHQLFLGNLLVSQIEDNDKRWDTLSKLAINLSGRFEKDGQ